MFGTDSVPGFRGQISILESLSVPGFGVTFRTKFRGQLLTQKF